MIKHCKIILICFSYICGISTADINEEEIIWKSIPVIISSDIIKKRQGGEGFQMVESIKFSISNPNIVYMSTNTSQVWKSIDGGRYWRSVRNGILSHGIASLAISENNPNVVFAAGTYGTSKDRSNKFPKRYEGIYRTINGGEIWKYVKSTNFSTNKNKGNLIAIVGEHKDTSKIYAASSSDGLLMSTDNGDTWSVINKSLKYITDIVTDRQLENIIYIASEDGLFRYDGNNFKKIGLNLPDRPLSIVVSNDGTNRMWVTVDNQGVFLSKNKGQSFEQTGGVDAVVLSISPVDNNLLFAKSDRSRNNAEPIVSNNGGKSWVKSKIVEELEPVFDHPKGQFWFSSPIEPHPNNSKVVLSASNGKGRVIRSHDYGKTWSYSGSGFTGARLGDIVFEQDEKRIFAFTDHGLWRSNEGDKGPFKYIPIPQVFDSRSVSTIAKHENLLVASVGSWTKKALIVSKNNGMSWKIHKSTISNSHSIIFDKRDENTIYAGFYISRDKGKNWKKIEYEIRALDTDNRIYAIKGNDSEFSIISSSDKGNSWRQESVSIPYNRKTINDVAVSGGKTKRIYIATSHGIILIKKGLYSLIKSESGLDLDPYGSLYVSDIEVDNNNPNIVYAARRSPGRGQSNGVFVSTDEGNSWSNINANLGEYLSVWKLFVDPYTSNVYISTSLGTFRLIVPDGWKS